MKFKIHADMVSIMNRLINLDGAILEENIISTRSIIWTQFSLSKFNSLLELPNEMVNEIIRFLPKHPMAIKLFLHIQNFEKLHGVSFYQ